MTSITTNTALDAPRPSVLARIGAAIVAGIVAHAEARARRDQIAALSALSDEDLACRGLTRDRIVSHVFADRLYL